MPDLPCRVAKLEVQLESQHVAYSEIKDTEDRLVQEFKHFEHEVLERLSTVRSDISEMKGFGAGLKVGAALVAGTIGATIVLIVKKIFGL